MNTNIKVIRVFKDLYSLPNYVLFEQKNKAYKLCVNRDGFYFTNDYTSDYICIYDNERFVSDYADFLPKYILNFFAKLLKKYGKDGLKEFQNSLN